MSTQDTERQLLTSGASAGGPLVPTAPPPPPVLPPTPPGRGRRRLWLLLPLLLAAGAGGALAWRHLQQTHALPPGIVSANGRIEAEQVDVASKYAGRLEAVLVDEGAMVQAGQVLARMETTELEAALRQAEAQGGQARQVQQARTAQVAQMESQLALAQSELDRARSLLATGAGTRQVYDQRQSAYTVAVAGLNAARAQLAEASQAVTAAGEAAERIRVQIRDSTLVAPITGRVQYRLARTGEVLAAGGRVLVLLDIGYVYMTVFLPTEQAGRLPIGTEARIVLDAVPDYVIPASITFVSPQAQFTPKQVETRSERDRLMFRTRLRIDAELLRSHAEEVRTGLPGIGYVRTDPGVAWPSWLQPGPRATR